MIQLRGTCREFGTGNWYAACATYQLDFRLCLPAERHAVADDLQREDLVRSLLGANLQHLAEGALPEMAENFEAPAVRGDDLVRYRYDEVAVLVVHAAARDRILQMKENTSAPGKCEEWGGDKCVDEQRARME